jgi:hypothetical protein
MHVPDGKKRRGLSLNALQAISYQPPDDANVKSKKERKTI